MINQKIIFRYLIFGFAGFKRAIKWAVFQFYIFECDQNGPIFILLLVLKYFSYFCPEIFKIYYIHHAIIKKSIQYLGYPCITY